MPERLRLREALGITPIGLRLTQARLGLVGDPNLPKARFDTCALTMDQAADQATQRSQCEARVACEQAGHGYAVAVTVSPTPNPQFRRRIRRTP